MPNGHQVSSLSIFFPCYNDWGTISSMVVLSVAALEKAGIGDAEIIIVDDGSREQTQLVVDHLAAHYDLVKVVRHEKNRGYGGALRSGFAAASKEFIFYTDGDAQYDPTELEVLLPHMRDGVDIVNGYKIKRSDPWYRTVLGRCYHHIAKVLFGLPIRDVDCDFRLLRRSAYERITLESNSGTICLELIKKLADAGCRFEEVPVHHYFRVSGRSEFFNFRRVARVILGIFEMYIKLQVRKEHLKPNSVSAPHGPRQPIA